MGNQCSLLNLTLLCLFFKAVFHSVLVWVMSLLSTLVPVNYEVSWYLGLLLQGISTRYHLLSSFKWGQWSTLFFLRTTPLFSTVGSSWWVPISPWLLISLQGRYWYFQMLIFSELFLRWSTHIVCSRMYKEQEFFFIMCSRKKNIIYKEDM